MRPIVFEPIGLMGKNLSIAGYHLTPLLAERELCEPPMRELTALAASGDLRVVIGSRYALDDARAAFEALESRATTGKVLIVP